MSKLGSLRSGLKWGGASTLIVAGFQLLFMAMMARLLEPADFGLVSIANVALRFLSYFSQMGVGAAIIQKEKIGDGDISAAFSISLAVSIFCSLLALVCASLVSQFFSMPLLKQVVWWLSLGFVFTGMGAVSNGLLRRSLRFKRLAINDAVAYIFGYGAIGLAFAFGGWGVWALVAASLSQTLLSTILSYSATSHSLSFKHSKNERRHFLSFGGKYSLVGFLEFLGSNLDAILIGKTLGESAAGLYNRALLLANLPVQQPANILTRALFPLLSSIGGQKEKESISIQLSMLLVGSYAFSIAGGISAASNDIVFVLLGVKWMASAPVLKVLAASVGPIFVSHVCGVSFDATGAIGLKLRIQIFTVVGLLCALLFGAQAGLVGIAAAIVVIETFRMLIYLLFVVRMNGIVTVDICRILFTHAIFGITAWLLVYAAVIFGSELKIAALRFALDMVAGGVSMVFSAALCRLFLSDSPSVRWLVGRVPKLARLFTYSQ